MSKPIVSLLALFAGVALALVAFRGTIADMFTPAPQLEPALRLIQQGKYEQAEGSLRAYLARYPENEQARYTLARLLIRRDDPPGREILTLLHGVTERLDRGEALRALVVEGQAHEALHGLRAAESCYQQALASDPRAPQALWRLMQLYYLEGRDDEREAVVLRRVSRERSPLVRVRYLREHLRHEVQRLSAAGLAEDLEAPYRLDPDDRHVAIAYGRALVRDGALDEGLAILEANRDRHGDADSWHAYLVGLDEAGEHSALKAALAALPESLVADARFAEFRGQVALNDGAYPRAIAALESFLAVRPGSRKALFRLERALRLGGFAERAEEVGKRMNLVTACLAEQVELSRRLETLDERQILDHPALCRRVAALRKSLGHAEEGMAWESLAGEPVRPL